MGRGRCGRFMTRIPFNFMISSKERDDSKIWIKKKLSAERGSVDDADNKLGEPYVTDD